MLIAVVLIWFCLILH